MESTSPHQDLVSLVNALELSTQEFTDVATLRARVLTQLNLLIFSGSIPNPLTISASPSGSAVITLNSFGSFSRFIGTRANGTNIAPTALTVGQNIVHHRIQGYGATKYSNQHPFISINTAENWSDTAHGFSILLSTTPKTLDTEVQRLAIDSEGDIIPGNGPLLTTATDGFVYMQSCAGTPTGIPTNAASGKPFVYDSTNDKIYIYNGSWKATAALV